MFKYTIHTQDKNLKGIKRILHSYLVNAGYTIRRVEGAWKGKTEKALEIVIIHMTPLNNVLTPMANAIRQLNREEVVLVTTEKVEGVLV